MAETAGPSSSSASQEANQQPAGQTATIESTWKDLTVAGASFLGASTKAATAQFNEITDAVSKAGSELLKEGLTLFARSLSWVASDPKTGPSLIEDLVKLAPVVGTTKMYTDAWAKYHYGKQAQDENLVKEAKRECFIALVSAGLDVTTLGVSAAARSGLSLTLKGVAGAHFFASIDTVQKKLIVPLVDQALTNETVASVVESMLTSIPPVKQADNS